MGSSSLRRRRASAIPLTADTETAPVLTAFAQSSPENRRAHPSPHAIVAGDMRLLIFFVAAHRHDSAEERRGAA